MSRHPPLLPSPFALPRVRSEARLYTLRNQFRQYRLLRRGGCAVSPAAPFNPPRASSLLCVVLLKGLLIDFYERFEPRHDHKVVQLLLSSLFSTRFSSFLISRGYRCSFARVGSDLNLNTLLRAVNMVFVWCVTEVSRGSS